MRRARHIFLVLLSVTVLAQIQSRGQQATPAQPQSVAPRTILEPGLRDWPDYRRFVVDPRPLYVPEGFTPLFNGKDLSGWHLSSTSSHGLTPEFRVVHGVIVGTQRPLGQGGILLTDRKFRDFELYMEVNPDWGNDSGLFFRAAESGAGYQITMDYLEGGSLGRLVGEGGIACDCPPRPPGDDPGISLWKKGEWNAVRIRVVGDNPTATVWINDVKVTEATDSANHAVRGMLEAPIAIQVHGGGVRWRPGGMWRWRTIAIRDLPRQ